MALRAIPHMTAGASIINIGSLSAFMPLPYLNIYAATKVFVKNYSLALREELKPAGINVTAVCPGWIDTNLYARADIGAKKSVNTFTGMVKPDVVARKAIADAKTNRALSVYGFLPNAVRLIAKILPASNTKTDAGTTLWARLRYASAAHTERRAPCSTLFPQKKQTRPSSPSQRSIDIFR